jgi:hypothetical protein
MPHCWVGRCCYLLELVAKVWTQTRKIVGVEGAQWRGRTAAGCRSESQERASCLWLPTLLALEPGGQTTSQSCPCLGLMTQTYSQHHWSVSSSAADQANSASFTPLRCEWTLAARDQGASYLTSRTGDNASVLLDLWGSGFFLVKWRD